MTTRTKGWAWILTAALAAWAAAVLVVNAAYHIISSGLAWLITTVIAPVFGGGAL